MFEEKEKQTTSLKDLIELVERDSIPTNEFTIEDKDPLVILGKLNEVVAYLESLQATINSSDTKANEALKTAKQAIADATQALNVANGIDAKATQALTNAVNAVATANTALNASNTALNTANTALDTANTALDSSNSAVETANTADTKATNAVNTANSASSTANEAKTTANEALTQVVSGLGTKVYRDSELLANFDVKPIEQNIANNTTAINNEATTRANAVKALEDAKVDKVSGKQLSTEDYTTAEKTKLAGLYNYNDSQVKADITALQTRATNIETKNSEQDTSIDNINNNFSNYLKITDLIDKIYPIGSIYLSVNIKSPASFIGGGWLMLPAGYALWTAESGFADGTLNAGLPNIQGNIYFANLFNENVEADGAFTVSAGTKASHTANNSNSRTRAVTTLDASKSNSIYGNSSTVQPPAYKVYAWKRVG